MKKYIIPFHLGLWAFGIQFSSAQVGINTDTPLATMHIESSDEENPMNTDGILIPRVTALNMTDTKEKGLLVFLDYENPATPEVEKGFYWWDGTTWRPFFSMNKMTKNLTVSYAACTSAFFEGTNLTTGSTHVRKMRFDPLTLLANDVGSFSVNAQGEFVVQKAGTYQLLAVVSLRSESTDAARDSFEAKILVNGTEPTNVLRTAYGFPSGNTIYDSNSTISGAVKLNPGDRIAIEINRYYRDTGTNVIISPNGSLSSLTLTYLGDF
jgi:hypothetical protein